MPSYFLRCRTSRAGAASPVVLLLTGILIAIIVLIGVLVVRSPGSASGVNEKGGVVTNTKLDQKPLKDPNRIQEVLKAGSNYRAIVKAGLEARVEDADWGVVEIVNLAYAAELVINRNIESNDGKKIVELRHFEACRNVKLESSSEVHIDLGGPGELALIALEGYYPGTYEAATLLKPLAEGILSATSESIIDQRNAKFKAAINSLSGKKVRIVYVDGDQAGVQSLEPVSCTLTDDERNFLLNTAVVSDAHIMKANMAPGSSWSIDGAQFGGFLDPTMRGVPHGEIVVTREPDTSVSSRPFAVLRVTRGTLQLDNSDQSHSRIGTFVPQGNLRYDLTDDYVSGAEFTGDFTIQSLSKDHILFEARTRSEPKLKITYTCQMGR